MRLRYTTFFGTYDKYNVSAEEKLRIGTIESTEARKQLLLRQLEYHCASSLPRSRSGQFQVAQNDLAKSRWRRVPCGTLTHNTYTQLSSEMGLPGLGDLSRDALLRLQDPEFHHPHQDQEPDLERPACSGAVAAHCIYPVSSRSPSSTPLATTLTFPFLPASPLLSDSWHRSSAPSIAWPKRRRVSKR